MQTLEYRQQKMQEKRKQTPWREFVKEIASWFPLVFNKSYGRSSRFPQTNRIGGITDFFEFDQKRGSVSKDYSGDILSDLQNIMTQSMFPPFMHRGNNENANYSDIVANAKNAYLSITLVGNVENILYSRSIKNNCQNILSSIMVWKNSSNIFECSCVINSFNIFYSHIIQNSNNIWFSSNLINCSECILCNNIENKSYCIRNIEYPKEEYFLLKGDLLKEKEISKYILKSGYQKGNQGSELCYGQGIINSHNIKEGYYVNQTHNASNIILFGSTVDNENAYDVINAGSPDGNHIYAGLSLSGEHLYCSCHCAESMNIFYSYYLESCSYCFGCIGLKNKSFCILNKQYTKEERYKKVDEIFAQMDKDGTLGSFFPATMNPFYFNDTAAYLIDDTFTKEEVEKAGYLRRDVPIKVDIPLGFEIITIADIDQYQGYNHEGNRGINPEILKKIIIDDEGNSYRIIKMEYDFLMKYGLPLPRKHRLTRMKDNFKI